MTLFAAIVAQLLHIALVLVAAPTVAGLQARIEAWLSGRRGAPVLQPWHELIRLTRKQPLIVESASWTSRVAPSVCFATTMAAVALVPSFTLGMAFAPLSDLIAIIGLLALARTVRALAMHDPGTAAGGVVGARGMRLSLLAEPALLLGVLTLAVLAGTTNLDLLVGLQREGLMQPAAASALAAATLVSIALVRSLEPAPAAVASGIEAVTPLTEALETLFWLDLLGCLFLPIGLARADAGIAAWVTGLATWAVRLAGLTVALACCRALMETRRSRAATELLAIAGLLALIAAVFAIASTGAA